MVGRRLSRLNGRVLALSTETGCSLARYRSARFDPPPPLALPSVDRRRCPIPAIPSVV